MNPASKKTLIYLVILVCLFVVGFVVVKISRDNSINPKTLDTELHPTNTAAGEFVYSQALPTTTEALWPDASEVLDNPPGQPLTEDLFSVYKQMRTALYNSDRKELDKFTSRGTLFLIDVPSFSIGGDTEGNMIFELIENPILNANKYLFAIQSWFLSSPFSTESIQINNLTQTDQFNGKTTGLNQKTLVYVKDHVPVNKYLYNDWRYKATLFVSVENDPIIGKASGKINFVYDQGVWKYSEEMWDISDDFSNIKFFDLSNGQCTTEQVIDIASLADTVDPNLNSISTSADCLVFNNLTGTLLTSKDGVVTYHTPNLTDSTFKIKTQDSLNYSIITFDKLIKGKIIFNGQ